MTTITIDIKTYEKKLQEQCVLINFYLLRALRRIASHIVYLNDMQAFETFDKLFEMELDPRRDFHRFHTFDKVIAAFRCLPNADEYLDELLFAYDDWKQSLEETSHSCDNL